MKCECQKVTHSHPNLTVKLDQYRLIEVAGVDAEKYLQGQLTCDVSKLAIGEQTLTCHCDPKGKMSSLFRLYRHAETQFFVMMPQDLLPEALAQLKKYAVFSKVTFSEVDTTLLGSTDGEFIAKIGTDLPACTAFVIKGAQPRAILWGDLTLETNGDSALWDLLEIQEGVPQLHKANQFELIPQATNLQCLENAISFTKGCYIGQETVARAKYRGANKRAMFTLVGKASADIGLPEIAGSVEMQIGENWKQTGTILAALHHQDKLWVQVVLNKELEADCQFRVNGIALALCDLPYELEN